MLYSSAFRERVVALAASVGWGSHVCACSTCLVYNQMGPNPPPLRAWSLVSWAIRTGRKAVELAAQAVGAYGQGYLSHGCVKCVCVYAWAQPTTPAHPRSVCATRGADGPGARHDGLGPLGALWADLPARQLHLRPGMPWKMLSLRIVLPCVTGHLP